MAASDMTSIEMLIGLIMMAVIGPAVGNYATSFVHRLPLGQSPFEKHPYCGRCGTMLQPKDLFPIWSYVWLRGRCRYCEVRIPPVHTWVEVACWVIFSVHFLLFGISETFLLLTALMVCVVTLAALNHQQSRQFFGVWACCFALAALYRVLQDGSIYPMLQSAVIALVLGVVVWKLWQRLSGYRSTSTPESTHYRLPDGLLWLALAGVLMPLEGVLIAVKLGIILGLMMWNLTLAAPIALWLGVLVMIYSHSIISL